MKKRELTPLEQILNDTLENAEKRMWDLLAEVMTLEDDIASLQEYLPRIKDIRQKLVSLQIDLATIRIDMDRRKSKKKTKKQ